MDNKKFVAGMHDELDLNNKFIRILLLMFKTLGSWSSLWKKGKEEGGSFSNFIRYHE